MCRTVRFVRSGDTGYLRGSKYFSVSRAKSGEVPTSPSPENLVNVHLGRKTVLPSELENKLVEYCITMDQIYYGLRCQDMTFQLDIRNGLNQPSNEEKLAFWRKWLRSCLKRHPILPVRTPDGISAARLYIRKRSKFF
jgi:hypothetical protein